MIVLLVVGGSGVGGRTELGGGGEIILREEKVEEEMGGIEIEKEKEAGGVSWRRTRRRIMIRKMNYMEGGERGKNLLKEEEGEISRKSWGAEKGGKRRRWRRRKRIGKWQTTRRKEERGINWRNRRR